MTSAPDHSGSTFDYVDFSEELKCAVCLEPFNDPIELKTCGHIFCKSCCETLRTCPECRSSITGRGEPNRIIKNMLSEVKMKCVRCGWTGTRASKASHIRCNQPGAPPAAATSQKQVVPATSFPAPQQWQQYPPQQPAGNSWGNPPAAGSYYPPPPHFAQQQPPPPSNSYGVAPYQGSQPPYHEPYWNQPPCAAPGGPLTYGAPYPPQPSMNGYAPPPGPPPPMPPRVIRSDGHRAPWVLYGFDQESYDQLVAIFMTFDDDGSGELDRSELTKLAKWLNFAQQPGDIDRMFREMDGDGSGALSMDEFCTWVSRNRPDPQALYGLTSSEYNCVMMAFRSYDANQDGTLSLDEFQRLCHSLGYYRTPQESAVAFKAIDTDHSGTVDLNEFLLYRAREKSRR